MPSRPERRPLVSLRSRASLRHVFRHPWQLGLTVLGVSLGVAITVALDLAIQSSREAFRISSETVTGLATHQVLAGTAGIPDDLVARLRIDAGVRHAAPVVEGWAVHPEQPGRALRILGVDPFSEAPFRPYLAGGPTGGVWRPGAGGTRLLAERGAVFLSRETADALGVGEDDALPLQAAGELHDLRVAGVLEPESALARRGLRDLLVVDLSEAQDLLDRVGRLDRIDLRLPDGAEGAGLLEAARALLPPGVRIAPAGSRERTMEGMLHAFDMNLTALSLLGLLFGVFLIYNTMTFSVVQRRRLFGTLRALGATRGALLRGVLAEAAVLGAVGAALGVTLGILLGRGLVRLVTRTINDLYFVVSVEGLSLPPEVLVKGALLGVGATLLASLPPAWEATTVSPREALARSSVEDRVRRLVPRAAALGGTLVVLGAGLLVLTSHSIAAAFGGLFAIVTGLALAVPAAAVLLLAPLRPALRRIGGIIAAMAARGVVTSLSRTAPAAAALVIAISVTVGLGIMIQSFRESVVRWLDVTLQADLYVSTPSVVASRAGGSLPESLAGRVREIPGVEGVGTSRTTEFTSNYGMTRLAAVELHPRGERSLDLLASESDPADGDPGDRDPADADGVDGDAARALHRFRAGEGVLVSEPFAFRHRLGPGDTVRLPADAHEVVLPVLGVYRDYAAEMGTIMIAREAYRRHWRDPGVSALAVFLQAGASEAEVEAAIRAAAGDVLAVNVRSNRELRALTLEVFDRTFEITRVLRLLAFLVAFIAVLTALMALQLERARELGVLRANGMTPGQTWGLVTAQTGILGAVAGLLALPVGAVLAAIMIHVVNRRSFGWTIDMEVDPLLLAQAVGLALAGALLAGIYPSWRMSRAAPSEALRTE